MGILFIFSSKRCVTHVPCSNVTYCNNFCIDKKEMGISFQINRNKSLYVENLGV